MTVPFKPLITGSLAYDHLMRIDDRFADHQSSASAAASYVSPSLQKMVGGCAGNIAYALRRLGDCPIIMAAAGKDFALYRAHLDEHDVDSEHIRIFQDCFTAQAYIVTDANNDQLTIFHPGATYYAREQNITDLPPSPLAIVAPNDTVGMLRYCRQLADSGTPFIFDPGQVVGLFSRDELISCLQQCTYAIFNVDEFQHLRRITGYSQQVVVDAIDALIITQGLNGSTVYLDDKTTITTTSINVGETKDPTGCGDAYRAGLLYGLLRGWPWLRNIRFASVVAGAKATAVGGQAYDLSLAMVTALYQQHYPDTQT